jgi:hypothetical protein
MIVDIILFILSCAGATQILCYGSILDKIRPKNGILGELFRCSMCVGFHVGYILFVLFWIAGVSIFSNFYIGALVFAFISSYTSYVCDKVLSDEGIMIKIANK